MFFGIPCIDHLAGGTVRGILNRRFEQALVFIVVLTLGVLGFMHQGVPAAEVDLNDGGVWVTKGDDKLVGHLNYQSRTLDGGLRALGTSFDVSQTGNSVVVNSPDLIQPLDTAMVAIAGETSVAKLVSSHGGDMVLFADQKKGRVWAVDVDGAGSFSPEVDPLLEVKSPTVIVGLTGVGFVLDAEGEAKKVSTDDGELMVESVGSLKMPVSDAVELTVVGDRLVALDTKEGRLQVLGGGKHDIEANEGSRLQQPGLSNGRVAVATQTNLMLVPLGGGSPTVIDVPKGTPAAPAMVDGCFYGLWSESGYYVRDCPDSSLNEAAQFPELTSATEPVFRFNRSSIVINDLADGSVYLPEESMEKVDNWDLVKNQIKEQEQRKTDDTEETEETTQEFTDTQHPPVAKDDELGARAGMSTTLPVLLNDYDADGDVLTAIIKDAPSDIPISLAKDGRAVRVEVPGSKKGQFKFTYQASDGVDLSNVATVTVSVSDPSTNGAPEVRRRNTINIAEKKAAEYSVLPDWVDPDGDPLFLEKAVGEEKLSVSFRQDGYISVRDQGKAGPGRRTVTVTVSDGKLTTTEDIAVQVAPGGSNHPPVANNDHYVASVGESIVLRPLANDTDADMDKIKLTSTDPVPAEVRTKLDHTEGTIQFSASKPGTQVIVYEISDGPNTAKGKIRVDVIDPKKSEGAPSAENDLALLPANGATVVEVLENDFDPSGGVLVIQNTSMGSAEGLTVETINHSVLRVSSPTGITEPQSFSYTISNGLKSASAKVLVVPMETKHEFQPPVAANDEAVVRVGDIVSIDVLANDHSPDELPLRVLPDIEVRGDETLGEAFLSGDLLRFKAGDEAGQVTVAYTVQDSENGISTAKASFVIRDFDDRNQQPAPKPIVARTFSGSEVRIPIPMDGIDPDGDSVELVGGGEASPKLGSIQTEGNYLRYTASPKSTGTDVFSYKVRDRFGAEGEGEIRVGIAPAPDKNQAPVAVPDVVNIRPDKRVEIPVTKNDVDPDGDEITLVKDSVRPVTDDWKVDIEFVGQKVALVTPSEPGVYQLYYGITDGGGTPVTGVATLNVDPDAPLLDPIARDDFVPISAILDLTEVEVDVLVNDEDPDGRKEDLTLAVAEPAQVRGNKVVVPLTEDRQVVLYEITDVDKNTAKAAIVVPGTEQIPPYIDPKRTPAKVKGGDTLAINFGEYVVTRPNHSAKLTSHDLVHSGPGGKADDKDQGVKIVDDTLIEFTPDTMFVGRTSVSFEVTDGASIDDPRGLRSKLSLPIEVESSGLFPPTLRPSEIKVAPGEDAVEVSLRDMVEDPDPGDEEKMAFQLVSKPGDVIAAISGQKISVSAPANKPVGPAGDIVVRVHDGSTDPLQMSLPVTVIKSTRPLMNVTDWAENEGRVGIATVVDLSKLITNPFADRGGEITVVGQPSVQGPAKVSLSGLNMSITPTDVSSSVVVTYVVQDATKDTSRQRTGTIRLNVKDVPKPPTDVFAEATASRTAQVSWRAGDWRGGTPKGFTVNYPGGSKDCGLVTNCEVTGLTNNRNYTFTVSAAVAESDIRPSDPSAASNQVWVDVRPNPPAAPQAKFGDRKIDLSWPVTQVPDGGSPVSQYTIEVTPAVNGKFQVTTSGTSYTWDGLTNGTAYTFRLKAKNKHEEESEWGPYSAPEIPAGAPSNQGAPTVTKDKAAAGVTPRANVSWSRPGNPNGDESFVYELRQSGSSEVLYTGSSNSTTVSMSVGTEDKTFQVRVKNKSDLWSDWSPSSNAVRAFQPPGAPTSFAVKPTGNSNQVTMTFGAAPGNGAKPGEISYRWQANGQSGTVTSGATFANGSAFPNGQNVTVTLTAISTVNGETAEGASTTATVNAYAPPGAPSAGASRAGNGNVDLSWNSPSSSNGRPITGVKVSTTHNSRSGTVGLSGSTQEGNSHDQNICITVRAVNSEGQESSAVQQCATTRGRGKAVEWAGSKTSCAAGVNPGANGCAVYEIELSNWYPNSSVICTTTTTNNTNGTQHYTVNGDGWARGPVRNVTVAVDYEGFTNGGDVSKDCHYA